MTHGGGAIYDRVPDDPDTPRRYLPSTPEAQAYIDQAERNGEPEADVARYRRDGVKLRPSEARKCLAGGGIGSRPVAGMFGAVLARVAGQRGMAAEVTP